MEHIDTSILTLIACTAQPGLEVFDQDTAAYLKIEETLEAGDLVLFVGQKMPQYTQSNLFTPLLHRVRLAPNPLPRLSIAFYLEKS